MFVFVCNLFSGSLLQFFYLTISIFGFSCSADEHERRGICEPARRGLERDTLILYFVHSSNTIIHIIRHIYIIYLIKIAIIALTIVGMYQ